MGFKRDLFFWRWFICCFSMLIYLGTAGGISPVLAQDEDEFTLEEITVTAEKREAELQKIPMEISVLRMDKMREMNVNQIYDLQKILPDVSTSSNVGNFVIVSIREVSTGQWNPMFETTVATHLDGVQLTRFGGLENFFFDLERVEVLKGPQGTLYGRGSTAGSMNMITKKPVLGEFGGNIEGEFGNYGLFRGDLAVNIPIIDKLAVRIAGRRQKRDGYSDSGYNDANSYSGRFSLRWEPTDLTTFTAVVDHTSTDDNGYAMSAGGAGGNLSGFYLTTYGDVTIVANEVEPLPPYTDGGPIFTRWQSRWAIGDLLDSNYNDSKHHGVTGILEHEFEIGTATIQFAHRSILEHKDFAWATIGLVPYPYTVSPYGTTYTGTYPVTEVVLRKGAVYSPWFWTVMSSDTESLEMRLTSKTSIAGGDKIEWIVGAMGQDDKVVETTRSTYPKIHTKSSALFGQASWMPFDKWNFTGGLRMNWDKKRFMGVLPRFPTDPVTGDYVRDLSNLTVYNYSWQEPTYKLNVSYIPTNDIMTYLQYSKGYRTGNVGYDGMANAPEILDAYELGFKSRWLDNRLQVNATAYYYDYNNYSSWANVTRCWGEQYADHTCEDAWTSPPPGSGSQNIGTPGPDGVVDSYDEENLGYVSFSPGGAEQMGVSVDVMWMLTPNDMVSFNGTWRDNKYGTPYNARAVLLAKFPDAVSPWRSDSDDRSGLPFGGAPIRFNAGYTHTWYIGADVLTTTGTLFYNGQGIDIYKNWLTDNFYKMPGRDAYWTGDISATYTSSRWVPSGMQWHARFRCTNVWDSDALDTITYTDDIPRGAQDVYSFASGIISGGYTLPRTYSISIGFDF